MRNGEVSYWWHARGGFPPRRTSLPKPGEADVCIAGGGYTGLWTAYYLKGMRPDLRVVVLEAAFAGYGASGRNGGWHGVAAANLAGRTLADLVLGVSSDLTSLPWVGHRSRGWEPEPARWAGVHGLHALYRLADRLETPVAAAADTAGGTG